MRRALFTWSLALTGVCLLAACRSPMATGNTPPRARQIPHRTTVHGVALVDNYHWLRDRDNRAVRAYLRAENNWTARQTAALKPLRETLYREMLSHIQETDQSVPYRDGAWLYYTRTTAGLQYPVYCRKKGAPNAPEKITLDLNALAKGHPFFAVGAYTVSDDGRLLAFTQDVTGFREYTLRVKDLATGKYLTEKIPHVSSVAWAADNRTLFYVTEDDAKRSYRLWRHTLGAQHDELLYEETDALFDLDVGRTRSRAFILLAAASKTTTEYRYLPADQPTAPFRVIAPRRQDIEYDVAHRGDRFYIRVNDAGRNFRVVTAPVADPGPAHWRELIPHRPDVMLDELDLFADFHVVWERRGGLPQLSVTDQTGQTRHVSFPAASYALGDSHNAEFHATGYRFNYESLVTPASVVEYDVATGAQQTLKVQPVPGYAAAAYTTERVIATAADGTPVPVSLVYRTDRKLPGGNPLLLDGYGAYGLPEDVWFSSARLGMLDRGVMFAIAHVRGGGEFGKPWHDAGRMHQKRNTFTDFIAAAEMLVAKGYTARDKLAITGGSAGGLLIGVVLNERPDLFHAAALEVPFVDVINTMLDESLPLTVTEFEEWGNPKTKADFEYLRAYSPYDNIRPQAYPAILVETSFHDSQVMYWEPAKYVAKLRATKTDARPLLFKCEMAGGHGGQSGRYDALREQAFTDAWLLSQWGIDQ